MEVNRIKEALEYLADLYADQIGYEVKSFKAYEVEGSVKSA